MSLPLHHCAFSVICSELMRSISSLLTLAGLEDPSSAPSFQSVVLDQIKHLRKQLEEDEQAVELSTYSTGLHGEPAEGSQSMASYEEEGRQARYALSQVLGSDGLPQMFAEGERAHAPPLFIQGQL